MSEDGSTGGAAGEPETQRQSIQWIPVDDLRLDPRNPRLLFEGEPEEPAILERLYEEEDLDEIALSMAVDGFWVEEPIVVVREPIGGQEHFVAIDGNRRLAVAKLLRSPDKRARLHIDHWPNPSAEVVQGLSDIPCIVRSKREDLDSFLVFRHISGIRKWEYFQRSQFIGRLIDSGKSIEEIEKHGGADSATIRKLYLTYLVSKHIRELDVETRPIFRSYSLMEVALSRRSIKTALGLPQRNPSEQTDSILDEGALPVLEDLVSFIYGDERSGKGPVIKDSRQIGERLAPVFESAESLEHLRLHRDLDAAYELTDGEYKFLLRQIEAAKRSIQRAMTKAFLFSTDADAKDSVSELLLAANALRKLIPNSDEADDGSESP